jgi:DNA-binding response OmpR family regulator
MSGAPSARPCVLLVEDDQTLRLVLADNLQQEDYRVLEAGTLQEARRLLEAGPVDLVVLDVMLPDGDGYAFCRWMRAEGFRSVVLMLTARALEEDIVAGLEAGAEDYVVKPYRLRELLARVRALLRRPGSKRPATLLFARFQLDLDRRTLRREDDEIVLTRTEFDLLAHLLLHRDRTLSRSEILDEVWGRDVVVAPRTVDNFISSLKRKLSWEPECGFEIHTIRGVGYRIEVMGGVEAREGPESGVA